jgi:hypothetical protein
MKFKEDDDKKYVSVAHGTKLHKMCKGTNGVFEETDCFR